MPGRARNSDCRKGIPWRRGTSALDRKLHWMQLRVRRSRRVLATGLCGPSTRDTSCTRYTRRTGRRFRSVQPCQGPRNRRELLKNPIINDRLFFVNFSFSKEDIRHSRNREFYLWLWSVSLSIWNLLIDMNRRRLINCYFNYIVIYCDFIIVTFGTIFNGWSFKQIVWIFRSWYLYLLKV